MALVLLDDILGIVVGVEGVHQDEWNIDIICAVEVFDLPDREIEEGHAITDFDHRFGTNTTHRSTETAIELENSKLVQEPDRLGIGKVVVVNNLVWCRWCNALPITAIYQSRPSLKVCGAKSLQLISLSLVVQVSSEKGKEVVHLCLK